MSDRSHIREIIVLNVERTWLRIMAPDELTCRHHVAHYTLLPMAFVSFGLPVAGLGRYLFFDGPMIHYVPFAWIGVMVCCTWIHFFGEYVIPAETYRKIRRGEL